MVLFEWLLCTRRCLEKDKEDYVSIQRDLKLNEQSQVKLHENHNERCLFVGMVNPSTMSRHILQPPGRQLWNICSRIKIQTTSGSQF